MKTQITYKLARLRMMGYWKQTTLYLNMDPCRTLPSNSQLDLCVGSVPTHYANLVGLISESWQGSRRQQGRGNDVTDCQTVHKRNTDLGMEWVEVELRLDWYRTGPVLVTWRVLIAIQTAARNKERAQQSRAAGCFSVPL